MRHCHGVPTVSTSRLLELPCCCVCTRATLAEITRENEFAVLYGLIACMCNITLAASQYIAGRLSQPAGHGNSPLSIEVCGHFAFANQMYPY